MVKNKKMYNEEEPMISYKKNKKSSGSLIQTMKKKPDVGEVFDWYKVPASDGRLYGLYVTLEKNNSPKIINLQDDVTIETSVNPGDIIYTLGVRDVDRDDISSLVVTMDSFSEYFELGNDSRSVLVKKTPFEGHYTLSFTAKDHCSDSATGNLKITVKTKVPFILNLPRGVNVREDVTNEVLLHELEVLAKGPYACNVKHVEPKPKRSPFLARYINTTNSWGIFLKANAPLKYEDEGNYVVTVECGEGKSMDSKDLVISVIPNSAPRFLNLPATAEVSAKSGVVGEVVYHVNAEDDENDPMIFDMSCDPDPCPFNITKGNIRSTRPQGCINVNSLGGSVILVDSLVDKGTQKYYLDVAVDDSYTKVGPRVLVINITDINHPPYIYNIRPHDSVKHYAMESLPVGSEIFKVIAVDIDVNDSIQFSMTISPSELTGFFDIDMYSGSIKTAAILDYEANKKNTISMYVSATDGKATTTQKLKVYITDVNEPPEFIYPEYVVHTTEIDPKGKDDFHLKLPNILAIDLDKDDKLRYSLHCGGDNSYFLIDAKKGDITQIAEYDVDVLSEPFHEIYCFVTATDIRGVESVANLTIIVDDVNDHGPAFERTRYLFVATRDMPLFSVIGQAFAYDADTAPPNNKLWYNIKFSTAPVTIDENGTLYLVQDLSNVQLGTLYQFSIEVTDGGNRSQTETVTIIVLAENYSTLNSVLRAEEFTFFAFPENMRLNVNGRAMFCTGNNVTD
ncbi:hypothetical protein CHS0354_042249 [Potamilus streckersoni]|uniref:Cadherin domain-containing protein n=1 Tax=Potamilus streckersoni TaxID=2493646 RepID=A0AAE0SU18_9BIVA|nr:hypothetical protein CHS0354_042249 [Potamilus streckersoni]